MNEYPDYLKSFSRAEYGAHIQKLQQEMGASGIDMLLLSSPENIFYATGYRSWYTSSLFRPVLVFVPRVGEPAISLRILEKSTVENMSQYLCGRHEEQESGTPQFRGTGGRNEKVPGRTGI